VPSINATTDKPGNSDGNLDFLTGV
jgi:hypothetical protein